MNHVSIHICIFRQFLGKNAIFFGGHFLSFSNKKFLIENLMWNNAWLEKKR